MEWAEELPENCPPDDAAQPNSEAFYRLVDTSPPGEIDFHSPYRLSPKRKFSCAYTSRALSIFVSDHYCNLLRKTPHFRGKLMIKIYLPQNSGVVKSTNPKTTHHEWWMAKGFDPTPHCSNCD